MSALETLKATKSYCEQQRAEKQKQLKKYEDEYDSLLAFSNVVEQSHAAFDSANTAKKNSLNRLEPLDAKCASAKEYREGSNQVFVRIGDYVVGKAYGGLDTMVGLRLASCRLMIAAIDVSIDTLDVQIRALSTQIWEAENAEDEGS